FFMENQAFLEITGYLMEALPYGMLWMDQAGNIVFANQKIAQEAGYTRKELRGMQIYDINPRTDPEAWRRHWEILTRDKSNYFKTYHQKKDGTFYAVEVHAYFFSNMRNQYICALIRDISQSYLYRQLLEQTEASAQVGGWEWDLEAQDLIASQESLKIFQVADSQELIPNRLIGKFPGEQGEAFQTALQQVLRQGQEADLILQGQIKANLKKWIHLTARPVYQNQQIIKVIGTYQDISQVKEREQALEAALAEIQRLQEQISAENEYLQQEVNPQLNFPDIICQSPAYRKVLDEVERVAPSDTTVLVTGETGTGKELLARAIHQLSRRSQRALIKVNCAAIPKNLIESELFGHRKGAFTGAVQDQIGRFELADQGTIFLDEIGELPLDLQPKLLRVLQEGEFERIGDPKTQVVDVRVISATNRDL
ncbi:MAG: sigma 54-interacting transcriptional regulator, partial [Bacteroidota bacterium]